jgi:CubicO group peptidase (beta-lactamase class C family)
MVSKQTNLTENWELKLDKVFEGMLTNELCAIPGLVVMAKRGKNVYHKAFGMADKEKSIKMEVDAQFRCFSMTKVLAATVLLMLAEKGVVDVEADVAEYLPSFGADFEVVKEPTESDQDV